jgi:hypothetical protein
MRADPPPPGEGKIGGRRFDEFKFQTADAARRSRGAVRPKFCRSFALENREGAGKTGCALHPRSRVQNVRVKTHTSIQVQRKHSGLPCAVVLRLIRARPGDRAFLPPSTARLCAILTPASGCQAHTISPSASAPFVKGASASTASHRAFRDDREPPLLPGETGKDVRVICPTG